MVSAVDVLVVAAFNNLQHVKVTDDVAGSTQ